MLSGKLLDAGGNVIAEASGPICPPDSQPHSQNAFDIWFQQPVAQHTSFQVRPIAGRTLDAPLPSPNIAIASIDAVRTTPPQPGGTVAFYVMLLLDNQSPTPYARPAGCVAFYDPSGKVVRVHTASGLAEIPRTGGILNGTLDTDVPETFAGLFFEEHPPPDAVQLRAWVWIPGPELGPSLYQFIMSDKVTIRIQPPQ